MIKKIEKNFFPLLNLLLFLKLFFESVKPTVISNVLIVFLLIFNIRYMKELLRGYNIIYLTYLFISLFSIVNYIYIENDFINFIQGVSYNLIPMYVFYLGIKYKEDIKIILKPLLISNLVLVSIGLYFYYIKPGIYVNYLIKSITNYQNLGGAGYRLMSYIGSMEMGTICVISFFLVLFLKDEYAKYMQLFMLLVFTFALALTMQRSAWVAFIIAILIDIVYILVIKKNILALLGVAFSVPASTLLANFIVSKVTPNSQLYWIIFRIQMLDSAVSERTNQWDSSLQIFKDNFFGIGLGNLGHKSTSLIKVTDGNYLRILGELGFFGMLNFILLLLFSLVRSLKINIYLFIIILVYIIQAIGTNVFDLYYVSHIYWVITGYVFNAKILKKNLD